MKNTISTIHWITNSNKLKKKKTEYADARMQWPNFFNLKSVHEIDEAYRECSAVLGIGPVASH